MKKFCVFLLYILAFTLCFASPYSWGSAIISGLTGVTSDPETIIIPNFSHLYGVAVSGNGRVWTSSFYPTYRYNRTIFVYNPQTASVDTIGPEITTPEGDLTLGYCRFFATLGNGNIAFGDWSNDRILVFDQDNYNVVDMSDSAYYCNVGGGIEAFVYSGAQYYLTQQIIGNSIVIWDSTFTPVDTLFGSPGGRNLAATEDGSVIVSPSLGGKYFTAFRGNPDDGYVLDTLYLDDLGIDMGNIMYVSSGPNDYVWLFSRDAMNDGAYVVDPYNDFEVKLHTLTDSSVSSLDDTDLGMAYASQYMIWLDQGTIDTSDVFTDLLYLHPWMLRSPCQVAYHYDGACEHLYMADYYGYTLKHWLRYSSRPFTLNISSIEVMPGQRDTVSVYGTLPPDYSFNSFEIALYGFLPVTQLNGLHPYGNDWTISYRVNHDTLYVEGNGGTSIRDVFSLFQIDLNIPDTISTDRIPIRFGKILFDDERQGIIEDDGMIRIQFLDVFSGEIAHDFGNVTPHTNPVADSYEFKIRNIGPNPLHDTITKSIDWISLSHDEYYLEPQDSLTVTVTATTSGLSAGSSHFGFIYVHNGDLTRIGKVETVILEENAAITDPITNYFLSDNFPNPFNPITHIQFSIKEETLVTISVFNIHGQKVAQLINSVQGSGHYDLTWDASSLPSGVYIYQLQAGDFIDTKKCMLIK